MSEHDNHPFSSSRRAPSVLTTWARSIVAALDARGVDGRSLAATAGIDAEAIADPTGRAPISATGRLWRLAVDATGDPCFGLFASRYLSFPTFQALGVAVLASASPRAAFTRLVRYSHIVSDAAEYSLEDDGDVCRLRIDIAEAAHLEHESVDAIASLKVRTLRALLGDRRHGPLRVALMRPRPDPDDAFLRFFRAPVVFGADANVLEFARDLVDTPLPGAHPDIAERSDEVMALALAERESATFRLRIEALVRERLPDGEPSQLEIARALGIGPRTLQRRLATENTSFAALVAEVRTVLAKTYLRDEGWSITEVAFSVGFREASSFSRAFRKWTGKSPSAFRR